MNTDLAVSELNREIALSTEIKIQGQIGIRKVRGDLIMSGHEPNFELPKNIERYLAALSKLYAQKGQKQMQAIIVNAQVRVSEGWSCDNWNGGTYGHALYLVVPETLYLSLVNKKDVLQQQIEEDINKLHNIQNEYIERVFLEMEVAGDLDW